jgi:hypothetical protein
MKTNLKHIPTKKLLEILSSNHCTGINGADYEPVKEELQQILWKRQAQEKIDTDQFFELDTAN